MQGHVLGPLLWYKGINPIFDATVLNIVCTTCYADNTLIIAGDVFQMTHTLLQCMYSKY